MFIALTLKSPALQLAKFSYMPLLTEWNEFGNLEL